ncbi:MAG: hypothetical protein ABI169_03585 [Chitinophagaceae bacterium]
MPQTFTSAASPKGTIPYFTSSYSASATSRSGEDWASPAAPFSAPGVPPSAPARRDIIRLRL